jgi:hypothetical protein
MLFRGPAGVHPPLPSYDAPQPQPGTVEPPPQDGRPGSATPRPAEAPLHTVEELVRQTQRLLERLTRVTDVDERIGKTLHGFDPVNGDVERTLRTLRRDLSAVLGRDCLEWVDRADPWPLRAPDPHRLAQSLELIVDRIENHGLPTPQYRSACGGEPQEGPPPRRRDSESDDEYVGRHRGTTKIQIVAPATGSAEADLRSWRNVTDPEIDGAGVVLSGTDGRVNVSRRYALRGAEVSTVDIDRYVDAASTWASGKLRENGPDGVNLNDFRRYIRRLDRPVALTRTAARPHVVTRSVRHVRRATVRNCRYVAHGSFNTVNKTETARSGSSYAGHHPTVRQWYRNLTGPASDAVDPPGQVAGTMRRVS